MQASEERQLSSSSGPQSKRRLSLSSMAALTPRGKLSLPSFGPYHRQSSMKHEHTSYRIKDLFTPSRRSSVSTRGTATSNPSALQQDIQSEQHGPGPRAVKEAFVVDAERVWPSRDVDVSTLWDRKVDEHNALQTLCHIELLQHDNRLLIAYSLLGKLEQFLSQSPDGPCKARLQANMRGPMKEQLDLLRRRGPECYEAAEDLSGNEGWTLATRTGGFDTYTRFDDNGQLFVKVVGEQDTTSIFDQLVVVREAGLYHRWAPFICRSEAKEDFSPLDRLVYFELNAPLLHRDCLVRGYACDYSEKDMVLICGDPINSEDYPDLHLPPEPTSFMFYRMTISRFRCQIHLRGTHSGKVVLAAIIDPKVALPKTVVNFAISKIIGVLLYLILRTANRVKEEGHKPGTLGFDVLQRVRNDPYYAQHVLPRVLWYCEKRGWHWPGHLGLPDQASLQGDGSVQEHQEVSRPQLADRQDSGNRAAAQTSNTTASEKKRRRSFNSLFRSSKKVINPAQSSVRPVIASTQQPNTLSCQEAEQVTQPQPAPPKPVLPALQPSVSMSANNDTISFLLPTLTLSYLLVTFFLSPLLRRYLGPLGEGVILAILLRQLVGWLLYRKHLELTDLPLIGKLDVSWSGRATHHLPSMVLGVALACMTWQAASVTSQTHIVVRREGVTEDAWASRVGARVQTVNCVVYVAISLLVLGQTKVWDQLRKSVAA